jgi:hypothetical protein
MTKGKAGGTDEKEGVMLWGLSGGPFSIKTELLRWAHPRGEKKSVSENTAVHKIRITLRRKTSVILFAVAEKEACPVKTLLPL